MKPKILAMAAAASLLLSVSSLQAQVCGENGATPINVGPADASGVFTQYVVDSTGQGLQLCTDGSANCVIVDPVVPGNALSALSGFGMEGFLYAAQNDFSAGVITGLYEGAVEATYLSAAPDATQALMFTRLRIRMGTPLPGVYRITHPWGVKTYTVAAADTKKAINETIDIAFTPNTTVSGVVGPWVRWDTGAPAGYLGDSVTPHKVTGSPCGTNFVKIEAFQANGTTPMAINGTSNTIISDLFVVQGKISTGATPIAATNVYYGRNPALYLTAFATSLPAATVTSDLGGALTGDGSGRFFQSTPLVGVTVPPTSVTLTSSSVQAANGTLTVPVRDLVTIDKAEAVCTTAAPKTCNLTVNAFSSDRDPTAAPTLTMTFKNAQISNGTVSVPGLTAVPATVTVTSTAGGQATKSVTIINQ